MRIFLIEVNIESNDVVFAPFVAGESVNILCSILDVFTAGYVRVVRAMFPINCLISECQLVHPVAASSEDDVDNGAAVRLLAFPLHLLIRVGDSTNPQCLAHPIRDVFRGVNRLNNATLCNLKVEMSTGYIVIAILGGTLPVLSRPPSLMFVRLVCGNAR